MTTKSERRAEIIRVQEELEALDRMGDALDDAHAALTALTRVAATNPAKFRSALTVGLEATDAVTKQRAIVKGEATKLETYHDAITRNRPLEALYEARSTGEAVAEVTR